MKKKISLEIYVDEEMPIRCHAECPKILIIYKPAFTKAWCTLRNGNKESLTDFPKIGPAVFLRTELCFSLIGQKP